MNGAPIVMAGEGIPAVFLLLTIFVSRPLLLKYKPSSESLPQQFCLNYKHDFEKDDVHYFALLCPSDKQPIRPSAKEPAREVGHVGP